MLSDKMVSDDELPDDEEEILVYVEFDGMIADNAFSNEQLRLDMLGIDTEHPIMQINGRFYEGTYEDAVGTYMFFTKNDNTTVDDPVFDTPASLKYCGKTRKLLRMQRVFIENRAEVLGDSEHNQCTPNFDTLIEAGVPIKYQEEALSFWKKLRDYRMDVLNSYLEKQRIREEKKAKGIAIDSESDEDHPFAAYRNKETQNGIKSENKNVETKNQKQELQHAAIKAIQHVESAPISECVNTKEATVIENEHDNHYSYVEVMPANIEPSTSAEAKSNATDTKKGHKKKQPTVQTRKVHAVHGIKKKRGKKSQVSIIEKDLFLEEKEQKEEIKQELNNSEIRKPADLSKIPHTSEQISMEESNIPNLQESEMDTAQVNPESKQSIKQLKREAKMQEILERLKILANEQMAMKTD